MTQKIPLTQELTKEFMEYLEEKAHEWARANNIADLSIKFTKEKSLFYAVIDCLDRNDENIIQIRLTAADKNYKKI